MAGNRIGLAGYMGLAALAAVNLAVFRDLANLLTLPTIATFLVLLDLTLARLLLWRRPLSSFDYGFVFAGLFAAIAALPYNDDPYILRSIIDLYRNATGKPRIYRYNFDDPLLGWERASLGGFILVSALSGGALGAWEDRWTRRRSDKIEPIDTIEV